MQALATMLVWLLVLPTNALASVQSENRIKLKNRIGGSESPRRHSAGGQRCYVLIRSGEKGSAREKPHQGTGTTRYLLDGASVLEELDGTNATAIAYLNNPQKIDEVLAYQRHSAAEYPHTDALGSVYAATDSTGVVVHRYDFDVYGKRADLGGSAAAIDVGYTGRRHDPNGLINNGRRERNPLLATWMSADPIGMVGGPNAYSYVGANPVMFTDPTGMIRDSITSRFTVALAAALATGGQHIGEAAHLFELLTGSETAGRMLQAMLALTHNVSGPLYGQCERVAAALGDTFANSGAAVEYVKISLNSPGPMGFETVAGDPGSTVRIGETGYHWVMVVEGLVMDAFTAPLGGVPLEEYLDRIFPRDFVHTVQPTPPPVP